MLFLLGHFNGRKNSSVRKSDYKSAPVIKLNLFYGCACSSGITLAALGFDVGFFSIDYPVSVFADFNSGSYAVFAIRTVSSIRSVFAVFSLVTLNVSKRSPGFAVIVRNLKLVIFYLERRSYTIRAVFAIYTIGAVGSVRAVFTVFSLVAFVTLNVSERSPGFAVIVRNLKLVIFYLERRSYTVFAIYTIGAVSSIRSVFTVFSLVAFVTLNVSE